MEYALKAINICAAAGYHLVAESGQHVLHQLVALPDPLVLVPTTGPLEYLRDHRDKYP